MNKKVVTFTVAMVLLLGVTLGATLALLITQTDPVTNTFVAGKIGTLELEEPSVTNPDQLVVIPGGTETKDPTITFTPDEVGVTADDVYVYIEVTGLTNTWSVDDSNVSNGSGNYVVSTAVSDVDDAITFNVNAAEWTYLADVTDRVVFVSLASGDDLTAGTVKFIVEDTVYYSGDLDSTDLEALEDGENNATTTLTFTGYAAQKVEGKSESEVFTENF